MSLKIFWGKIKVVLSLIRLPTTFIAASIPALVMYFSTHDHARAILLWCVLFCTTSYGFSINEFVDHMKDKTSPDGHVIASGLLNDRAAFAIAICFFCMSFVISLTLSGFQQMVNIILLVLLSLYSSINNRFGILANIIVALCSGLSIVCAAKSNEVSIINLSFFTYFMFILGREIILDVHDMDADRAIGKTSLPILFSVKGSFLISVFFSGACVVYSFGLSLFFGNWNYLIFISLAQVLYIVGLHGYWKRKNEQSYKRFIFLSRLSFLMIIPGILM